MKGKSDDVHHLNEMKMGEIKDSTDAVLFLPIGISEGHGKHLPAGTDTIQAEYVTERVAEEVKGKTIIAPILNYGTCRATSHLPGTISVSFDSLRDFVQDILSSIIDQGFEKIVIISGHAGKSHMMALELAAKKVLGDEEAKIMVLSGYDYAYDVRGDSVPDSDGHGGRIETSRVMDIRGDLVGEEKPEHSVDYPEHLVIKDYSEYLTHGMRGRADRASEEEGKEINDYVIEKIKEAVEKTLLDK